MLEDRGEEFVACIVQNNWSLQIINLTVLNLYSTARILSRKENKNIYILGEGYDLTRDSCPFLIIQEKYISKDDE